MMELTGRFMGEDMEEELKDLDCRDSDYEYEEVVVSKDFGYSKLYEEVVKNNTERLKRIARVSF